MRVHCTDSVCAVCPLGGASKPEPCPFHDQAKPAGTLILRQGEVPDRAWYVKQGTVLLSSVSTTGEETFCALRGPNSLLGLELLRDRPSGFEAWALSDVVLCRLDADSFRTWVGDERTALTGRSLQRVARFLLERRRLEGCDQPLHVEQQVLARMLGIRAETMSRALAELRRRGALAEGRVVTVVDAAELARAAGEDQPFEDE
jgi:CRP-like cAMP-binding protein